MSFFVYSRSKYTKTYYTCSSVTVYNRSTSHVRVAVHCCADHLPLSDSAPFSFLSSVSYVWSLVKKRNRRQRVRREELLTDADNFCPYTRSDSRKGKLKSSACLVSRTGLYVHIYIYIYVHTYVDLSRHVHTCTYTCVCIFVQTHTHVYLYVGRMRLFKFCSCGTCDAAQRRSVHSIMKGELRRSKLMLPTAWWVSP